MNKYVVLYRASTSAADQMANATPEQMQAGMDAWMSWSQRAGSAIVDLGTPLGNGRHIADGGAAPSDSDISAGKPIIAAAISGEYQQLKQSEYVSLPWHRNGHPRTRLREAELPDVRHDHGEHAQCFE